MLLRCENSSNIKEASRDICPELLQCRYCGIEYKTGIERNNGCTTKFTITIWKDLGQGPGTKEWKAHIPFQDEISFPQSIQLQRGEIAATFQVRGLNWARDKVS
jgi:hypothetical protein